ncbi:leucine-rich repeat domain-containing protein [Mesomycoplasma conjunctivae]|uniref:leucine-rich repeat domain-containing protein n=1 Tax=Mesomycoplasma conjunctivae TaxID=45361 RepID=UPI003DA31FA5
MQKSIISRKEAMSIINNPNYRKNDVLDLSSLEATEIATYAFSALNLQLSKLILPKGLQKIGDSAFMLNEIQEIVWNDEIQEIGDSAFEHNLISKIELPKTIQKLSPLAFAMNQIKEVVIFKNIDEIGHDVFHGNPLEKLYFYTLNCQIDPYSFAGLEPKEIIVENDFDLQIANENDKYSRINLDFYKDFDIYENEIELEIANSLLVDILASFSWINAEKIILINPKVSATKDLNLYVVKYEMQKNIQIFARGSEKYQKFLKIN